MKYDISTLQKQVNAKKKLHYLFFWGETEKGAEVTKACLSQWYPCVFKAEGVIYHTAEQYMMAQKAKLFHDEDAFERIMAARSPKQYKGIGRQIRNFSDIAWNENKFNIVLAGNRAKFSQNARLKEFLVATGTKILAEASPYDGIWGIAMEETNPAAKNPLLWRGENLLGFALMEVRDSFTNAPENEAP